VLRWTDLSQIPDGYGPSVVTLGNFDGVHKGHRAVVSTVVEQAAARGARSVAVTFDPHPLALLHPERALQMITSPDQRLDLLSATGLDAVLVMEFTSELAGWTPERFVVDVFVKALGATLVVVGEDTRFGVRNSGDVGTLRQLGAEHGFEVLTLADVGNGGRWSSSRVRELVTTGDVSGVEQVLGRPHRMAGEVVHGDDLEIGALREGGTVEVAADAAEAVDANADGHDRLLVVRRGGVPQPGCSSLVLDGTTLPNLDDPSHHAGQPPSVRARPRPVALNRGYLAAVKGK